MSFLRSKNFIGPGDRQGRKTTVWQTRPAICLEPTKGNTHDRADTVTEVSRKSTGFAKTTFASRPAPRTVVPRTNHRVRWCWPKPGSRRSNRRPPTRATPSNLVCPGGTPARGCGAKRPGVVEVEPRRERMALQELPLSEVAPGEERRLGGRKRPPWPFFAFQFPPPDITPV